MMDLDSDMHKRLDEGRSGEADAPSRAEAAPRLTELTQADRGDGPSLSDGEKLIAFMLSGLMKTLDPEGGWVGNLVEKAIAGGHYWALDRELRQVFHDDRDNPTDVRFVMDVLDMWDRLELSFAELSEDDRARVAEAVPHFADGRFPGFDGNHEEGFLSIARFLVKDVGRFERFHDHPRLLDSHHPTINLYRGMLAAFEPIRMTLIGRAMNLEEMVRVLGG